MPGSADNRWEDSSWGIVARETGLYHARSVVNDQRSDIVVTHDVCQVGIWLSEDNLEGMGRICKERIIVFCILKNATS